MPKEWSELFGLTNPEFKERKKVISSTQQRVIEKTGYPSEWNKELQELVCRIYNFRCVLCGTAHSIHGHKGLVVHHIDYNKQNSHISNLVPLCRHCHDEIPPDSDSAMRHILQLPVVIKMHKMLGYA